MVFKNTTKYDCVAKSFHWSVALLVLGMLPLGFLMNNPSAYTTHKSIGLIILALMIGRTLWRLTHKPPTHPDLPAVFRRLAYLSHLTIYVAIFAMALSGWIMSTASGHAPHFLGLIELPMPGIPMNAALARFANQLHGILAWIIIGLVSLHILAAFYHHWIRRDQVLASML